MRMKLRTFASIRRLLLALTALLSVTLLAGGCSINHTPLQEGEVADRMLSDLEMLHINQRESQPKGPITLYEAIARAIKFNLEKRLKLLEEDIAASEGDFAEYAILPRVESSFSGKARDKDAGSFSRNPDTGVTSTTPSTSDEKLSVQSNLRVVFNLLDYGISYARARQTKDKQGIAKERRRKVMQRIVEDVRKAYWEALAASLVEKQVNELYAEIKKALATSRDLEQQKIQKPIKALEYQRTLLEIERKVSNMRHMVWNAKSTLSSLMSLKPGTPYRLHLPKGGLSVVDPVIFLSGRDLLRMALFNRSELREADYNVRISAEEMRIAYLRKFPSVELAGGFNWNSNELMLNNIWGDLATQMSQNLVQLYTHKEAMKIATSKNELEQLKRLAMSLTIMTQVHIVQQRVRLSLETYDLSLRINDVQARIYTHTYNESLNKTKSELDLVVSKANHLSDYMRSLIHYAQYQNLVGKLYTSIGIDPIEDFQLEAPLPTLTKQVYNNLNHANNKLFNELAKTNGQLQHRSALRFGALQVGGPGMIGTNTWQQTPLPQTGLFQQVTSWLQKEPWNAVSSNMVQIPGMPQGSGSVLVTPPPANVPQAPGMPPQRPRQPVPQPVQPGVQPMVPSPAGGQPQRTRRPMSVYHNSPSQGGYSLYLGGYYSSVRGQNYITQMRHHGYEPVMLTSRDSKGNPWHGLYLWNFGSMQQAAAAKRKVDGSLGISTVITRLGAAPVATTQNRMQPRPVPTTQNLQSRWQSSQRSHTTAQAKKSGKAGNMTFYGPDGKVIPSSEIVSMQPSSATFWSKLFQ
uniref:Putative Outer membrane efflux protein n=1 Tax=Magnetococcus massalia (strain MO-1) TaxID=451514 RepID=A0A1S7LCB8_MAGMO|nr:putative Outer membrane efflux protein [Candidatus Magnetococcus massalia]